jgi:hypothetical protein
MSELARWEARFSAPNFVFGTEPNEFLRSQAHLLPRRGKVLAVADGEGRNGVWLAQQGLDVISHLRRKRRRALRPGSARSRHAWNAST